MGTDCWQSKLGFNMWHEMRTAVERGSDPLPTCKEALQMATIGSARAMGLDHIIGTLEPGKKADLIAVALPDILCDDSIYDAMIKNTDPQHVKLVLVGGNILK